MGGCDKQGFPMKQGVLTPGRVRLLLHRGWCISFWTFIVRVLNNVGVLAMDRIINLLVLSGQALLASVVMEGVMESEEGSLFEGALSAKTFLF